MHIAVAYYDGRKTWSIRTMNIDGSSQKRLTFNDTRDSTSSWSSDGSKIIFVSENIDKDFDIYIMNADGSSVKKIIDGDGQPSWLKILN